MIHTALTAAIAAVIVLSVAGNAMAFLVWRRLASILDYLTEIEQDTRVEAHAHRVEDAPFRREQDSAP